MQFSEHSRVWVYQSDKELTDEQVLGLLSRLNKFAAEWTAHNHQLKAKAEVRYKRFLILIVDESQAGASGCSIDKSVNFMKGIEREFGINLFDRFNFAYRDREKVLSAPRSEFEELLKSGRIGTNTIVFNNLVQDLLQLETKWEVPFKESWHPALFGDLVAN
ncbi:ABC transporter ATPase [Mucilaginibacter ginsenosidivorans]|uniref:ABC transporter ATPase n=1 Tax=Mucilaginibacter ginsenosidivorans TaxID=398053 RepID=A0A5B8V178_9SPHI|nr:ABC transporter ATPase [Mucilaginibacter ginsenosidivorans]QEC65210.1 ABC transporter ATPase [Mucilaginibacter ginsenosidivorans]